MTDELAVDAMITLVVIVACVGLLGHLAEEFDRSRK